MLTGSQAPAGSPVLTAKLLADRTAATVLADPEVSPGQLVYLKELWETPTGPHSAEQEIAQAQWQTADDSVAYYGGGGYVISEGPVRRPTLAIQRGSVRSGHAGQRAWQH
jgi:hypothetical protein